MNFIGFYNINYSCIIFVVIRGYLLCMVLFIEGESVDYLGDVFLEEICSFFDFYKYKLFEEYI